MGLSRGRTELIDSLNRRITYLRVSLTEDCNFRCDYCYGSGDKPDMIKQRMSNKDISRIIPIFASLGINKIRFTGGEPLLRKGIIDIVRKTSDLNGIATIGMTTNGYRLSRLLGSLIDAGLNRLNISLDTLNRKNFKAITGIDGLDRVCSSIDEAEKSGALEYVKINSVIMRGINDSEIPRFVEWALPRKIDLRFIEFMPTDQSGWGEHLYVSEDEIKNKTGINLKEIPSGDQGSGPARSYRYENYPGRISFISAVSRCFCDGCNRLRLTARGELLGCLFQDRKIDLKEFLVSGLTDEKIAENIRLAVNVPEFRRSPGDVSIADTEPFMRGIGG